MAVVVVVVVIAVLRRRRKHSRPRSGATFVGILQQQLADVRIAVKCKEKARQAVAYSLVVTRVQPQQLMQMSGGFLAPADR